MIHALIQKLEERLKSEPSSRRWRCPVAVRALLALAVLGLLLFVAMVAGVGSFDRGSTGATTHGDYGSARNRGTSEPGVTGGPSAGIERNDAEAVCVEVRDPTGQLQFIELEVRTWRGFVRTIPVGRRSCLDVDPPAVLAPLDVRSDPGTLYVSEPGEYHFELVAPCRFSLTIRTDRGEPWAGSGWLSGADDFPSVAGLGPHDVSARCGAMVTLHTPDRSSFPFRATGEDIVLELPAGSPPCTTVEVVDPEGRPVEVEATRWELLGSSTVEVCSWRLTQVLSLTLASGERVVGDVDMAEDRTQLVVPELTAVSVTCSLDGDPVACAELELDCAATRSLGSALGDVGDPCSPAEGGRARCDCPLGGAVRARTAGAAWAACTEAGPAMAHCPVAAGSTNLEVVVANDDLLQGWAWLPDDGWAIAPLSSPVVLDLAPGPGRLLALAEQGWDEQRLTLLPDTDHVAAVQPQAYESLPVACARPLSVTWWLDGAVVGTLPVEAGDQVPAPRTELSMEAQVYCADGDHISLPLHP